MLSNKSFARRIGRRLSSSRKNLLSTILPKFLFSQDKLLQNCRRYRQIILEIGFGSGEHLLNQAALDPSTLFIGAEVYLNGVADLLRAIADKRIENILIWPDNIDLISSQIPADFLKGIYVLFPDPWQKRYQRNRRIFNEQWLKMITEKLSIGGFIAFASDIEDYFLACRNLLDSSNDFTAVGTSLSALRQNYLITRYHNKAIMEGRRAQFLYTSRTK